MKKILSVIMIAALLLCLAACGSGGSNHEDLYIGKAQALIDSGDYEGAKEVLENAQAQIPDSAKIKELLTSVNNTIEFSKVPTEDQVLERYNKMRDLADKWFVDGAVSVGDEFTEIQGELNGEGNGYSDLTGLPVTEKGIESTSDIYALFSDYCDEETVKSFETGIRYFDYEGKLYMVTGLSAVTIERGEAKVTKNSDEDFSVTYLETRDYVSFVDCTMHYTKGETKYLFGVAEEKVNTEHEGIEPGDYVISTKSDPLIMHDIPQSGTESIGTIPKGTIVTVTESFDNWAYVTYDETEGWVSSDYLTPYDEEDGGDDSYAGNSGANTVNQLVNAGINIAGGLINSLG